MGIFSFGKKDDDAPPRRGGRTGASRNVRTERTERVERRSRRTERPESDALLLDPTLPEKQRARRRLVGAIALVVAAVIVLPMVLDSHPKPVTDDIAIDIPNRPAHQAVAPRDDDVSDVQAGVAHDEPPASDTAVAAAPAPAPKDAAKPAAKPDTTTTASVTPPKPAPKPAAPAAKPVAPKPAPAAVANDGAASPDSSDASSPASPAGARFAVQLGSFKDDATARSWATKLKSAGVPAYVEHRKQADGSTATLLRAGPFADRSAASAAIAKVREAGLTQ
ncbi:TPA: SPOR domain-containing protein [Burkholderia cenocepacia]|uniref:SPOR domain-containing protein n=2 Tax=Burkholderia cenocepacia TaxID=95486 RepID=UPI001B94FA3D|nr:SPOR domain-containing protein [Burkholderia cenocepacia]MBR7980350.1 SPOR domain-containing protein [Burkholderia cenocepacia]HDR9807210.1 SPOR domain-containing protein [Burkholderia cenocepacia]HDR9814197.1 SPOR domain-containing protein [Burkholderia cenocepacia]HDR9820654.1 SPOR domain-containing protein [Burkholderia cenocepacia]HDR9831369.1 SPOR domain-containing protein [Burkholderia cenocepacia]